MHLNQIETNMDLTLAQQGGLLSAIRRSVMVLILMVGTGCSEHRISLEEFQELVRIAAEEEAAAEAATSQPTDSDAVDRHLGPYKVGNSDVLLVTLTTTDLTGAVPPVVQVRVDRDGSVMLPLVGKVPVGGLEIEDAEAAIQKAFVPNIIREMVVHAEMVSADATRVLVIGAVSIPGLVQLRNTESNLLFAIVQAGGVSELASGEVTLKRLRVPGEEVTLNLTTPEELKAALALNPLQDGDIVKVHTAQPNTIYAGGLVNVPSPLVFPQGLPVTILQALAAAGGLRTDVFPREGTLIRRMADGQDVQVKLDLNRIQVGKDPNITLAAGDILWVPHTWETRVQDWINKNIFFRAGVTATAGASYNATGIEYLNSNAERASNNAQFNSNLQDQFDPLGFLNQNAALQSLQNAAGT
jgi:polysaccharide export outer membrane protein